jgi:type IV pilus assembly protein PilN
MTGAINVEDIPALIQERLSQARRQLFPQRLRLQIADHGLSAQVLAKGKGPQPSPVEVPLPAGICHQGIPQNVAALGDFIGDWLLVQGVVAAQVEAVLPLSVCQWRVVIWPFDDHPEEPLQALRQLQIDLGDSLRLEQSSLGWEPLSAGPGGQARALLVAAPKPVVEAWQEVFTVAGVSLKRLIPAQVQQWRALQPLWCDDTSREHWFLELGVEVSRLWLVVDGVPEADWPLPACPPGVGFDPAWAEALQRCQRFWHQQAESHPPQDLAQPQRWYWYAGGQLGGAELWEQPLAALVQPWPLERVSLSELVLGWDRSTTGVDLLQETRGDQPGQAALATDWRPSLRRGAAIGAALVAALGVVAAGLAAIQVGHQAEIERLLPVQALADGLLARLQGERRRLGLLQRGNQALVDGLVAVRSGSALLEDLRRRTPTGVQLTEVRVESALLHLKGRATDPQAFARINALQLGLQASPLFQPQGVLLVKASRDEAPSGSGTGTGAGVTWRQPVVFELTAAFADRPALLDGHQLRALGADGMAQRLQLLQRAGVLP